MKQLKDLELIPRWLGEPMYFGGFPVKPEKHFWQDESAMDLYLKSGSCMFLDEEFDFLKQYVIYYIHAPCWQVTGNWTKFIASSYDIKTKEQLSDFIFDLMDYGIDIF